MASKHSVGNGSAKSNPVSPRSAGAQPSPRVTASAATVPALKSPRNNRSPARATNSRNSNVQSPKRDSSKVAGEALARLSSGNALVGLSTEHGFYSLQGKRPSNEDAHIMDEDFFREDLEYLQLKANEQFPLKLYAIFDGHGGDQCAKYMARHFPNKLLEKMKKMNKRSNVVKKAEEGAKDMGEMELVRIALCLTIEELDLNFIEEHVNSQAGCTAVIVLVDTMQKLLFCANLGDSRAMIGRLKSSLALSRDQDPNNESELARVNAAWGGTVDADSS